jgi:hypothetical protein
MTCWEENTMIATARPLFAAILGLMLSLGPADGICGDDDPAFVQKIKSITKGESITFEAKAYLRYWYQIQDPHVEGAGEKEPNANSFEVWRFYFGPKVQVTPWLMVRLTADVGPEKSVTSSAAEDGHSHKVSASARYELFLKYAYAQIRFAPGLHLQAGMIGNPYHGFTDKLWGGRYVAKNLGDEEKLWNSADLGVNLYYVLPGDYGELGVGFVNGAGYKNATDTDANKEVWIHAALSPFAGLGDLATRFKLAMLLQYDIPVVSDATQHLLASALVGYRGTWVQAGYQLIMDIDDMGGDADTMGLGHAAYLRLNSPWKVGLLGRAAIWDADLATKDVQTRYEILGGVYYKPVSLFEVALSASGAWRSGLSGVEEEADVRVLLSTLFAL